MHRTDPVVDASTHTDAKVVPAGWQRAELIQMISELTRRRIITTAAAAGLLARLPGRIGAQGTPVPGEWPRTVTGSLGEVIIPAQPERIVCVSDWGEVDYLMAMGVEPTIYGYTNRYGQGVAPWLAEAGGEALPHFDLSVADGLDVEQILLANPDLIISEPYFAQDILATLTEIAPTLGVPTTFTGATWRDAQTTIGQACGTETEAAAAIDDTNDAIEAGRISLSNLADRSVTVAYFSDDPSWSVVTAEGAALLTELGLTYNDLGSTDNFETHSMETIQELDRADLLLVLDFGFNETDFSEDPLFQSLSLAAEHRYAVLDILPTRAFWGQTTLSVKWCIPYLVSAVQTAAGAQSH